MTRQPQPCRYCGYVAIDHIREETCQWTRPDYSCRDVSECGARLRANKRAAGIPDDPPSDVPF